MLSTTDFVVESPNPLSHLNVQVTFVGPVHPEKALLALNWSGPPFAAGIGENPKSPPRLLATDDRLHEHVPAPTPLEVIVRVNGAPDPIDAVVGLPFIVAVTAGAGINAQEFAFEDQAPFTHEKLQEPVYALAQLPALPPVAVAGSAQFAIVVAGQPAPFTVTVMSPLVFVSPVDALNAWT